MPRWYLVQVDWEEMDPVEAWWQEVYQCKWWIKHHQDSASCKTKECRFWLEVWQRDGEGVLMWLVAVWLDWYKRFLWKNGGKYKWFQDQVCLAEHLLVGPFELIQRPSMEMLGKME